MNHEIILSAVLLGAMLHLVGCTTATVDMADGTKVTFTRIMSDADLQLSPDGLHYSSSPSAIAQQNANTMLAQALRAALGGVAPLYRQNPMPQAYRPLAVPPGFSNRYPLLVRLESSEVGI